MNIEYVLYFARCDFTVQYFVHRHDCLTETIYKTSSDVYHNIYDAANIHYNLNKSLLRVRYFINDKISRKYGPAVTEYYSKGNIAMLCYRIEGIPNHHYNPHTIQYRYGGELCFTVSSVNGENTFYYNDQ